MAGNSFGHIFRLTTFGDSHGAAIGGVIDGCPAGLTLNIEFILGELERRKPNYTGSTQRKEPDMPEFISGIQNGITTGFPIAFIIRNESFRASDYDNLKDVFRPSHADYTYRMKYGAGVGSGTGRASGRETVARVVAGAVAKLWLENSGIGINGFVSRVGQYSVDKEIRQAEYLYASKSVYGCPDADSEVIVRTLIEEVAKKGDTIGGAVRCKISGMPAGLGEPVFDKLQADLAKAMLGIGTAKAFEYGIGFQASGMTGSAYNDQMAISKGKPVFLTNHDGGIQGGISNGEDIYFHVGFKPVPSIKVPQQSIDVNGNQVELKIKGRHDSCHVPRLVVVVEAMAALVIADHLLISRSSRL